MRTRIVLAVALLVVVAGTLLTAWIRSTGSDSAQGASAFVFGPRTKTYGCITSGALPDRDCTPGAAFPGVTRDQICARGYARAVRDVPDDVKAQVYGEYGVSPRPARGTYEVDHLVSLELGGSNDIANLWPEAAEPKPGFHEKDRYENLLHEQLCAGAMSLMEAQRRIADNWLRNWEDSGRP